MRFKIKFLHGTETIAMIEGIKILHKHEITMEDVEMLIKTEKFLEKLIGLRVHIDCDIEE